MYIALSPTYAIRNEASSSFLIRVDRIINLNRTEFGSFCIPPFMGYILAHIGDYEYPESIKFISSTLKVSTTSIDYFVRQLIENSENKKFIYSETQAIVLPKALLKKYVERPNPVIYEAKSFNGLGEFVINRPSVPINANFMVTTNCSTDCIYYYANRKLHPILETQKILDIIRELHDLGTINIALTGGDIFAHPDWRIILNFIREKGYKPFLSTKTPLNFEQIKYLRELGYDEIQFSLDSVDPGILKTLINVKDNYLDKVSSFLKYCSELKLNVLIRSVLTKINASKDKISALYDYLAGFESVNEWTMTPAFFSKYKQAEYKSLEVNNEDLVWVHKLSQRSDLAFKIGLNKISEKGYVLRKFKTVEEYVCYNQICMANTTCISILANGDCSVCEMLYDNPDYLIGNVYKSSISKIWNSEKALNLYSMAKQSFPQSSPCKNCDVFDQCRNDYGKRVCYLDISKTGKTKWDPDPRCPRADNIDLIL